MRRLVGEYFHKLDSKGRVSLPSSFRKALDKDLVVTTSPEGDCLLVFDFEGFNNWVDSLFAHDGGFDAGNMRHVRARKVLNSRAKSVELDSSGRIGINANLRDAAGLDREVALIGDADHFEIWDAKRWSDFADGVDVSSIFTN